MDHSRLEQFLIARQCWSWTGSKETTNILPWQSLPIELSDNVLSAKLTTDIVGRNSFWLRALQRITAHGRISCPETRKIQ
jgi:hypothetical protein